MVLVKWWRRNLRPGARDRRFGVEIAACVLSAVALASCQVENRTRDERVREEVVDEEDPLPPNPGSCVCTEVAPFGYHGPSIVGRGTTLADIDCPEDATLPGFSGIVVATGQWARECRITPLPICALSGLVCAPAPPAGFSLCIYRGEAISCPDGYRNAEPVIETDGLQPLKNVTLCCADPAVPE